MFKRVMVILSVVAVATVAFGITQALGQTSQKTPGYMYAACNLRGVLSTTTNSHATGCLQEKQHGHYIVSFDRPVRGCALMGSVGADLDAFIVPAMIGTGWGSHPNQVTVDIRVPPNTSYKSRSFYVAVLC